MLLSASAHCRDDKGLFEKVAHAAVMHWVYWSRQIPSLWNPKTRCAHRLLIQWWHVSKCYLVTIKLHKFSNRLFNSYKWLQKFLVLWKCHTMPHKNVQNCQNIDEATINSLQTAAHISFCLHPLIPLLPVTSSTSVCVLSLGWQNFGKVGVCVGGCRGSRAWEERGLDLIRTD